ncbi:MAG: hypothetical protein JO217_08695 [Acidobacteriaceae bacterium]|nr:hypothetical protein [Acidobacteriaceae bacterium]
MLAAKAGAYIVSPFVGRVDDTGWPGADLIADIVAIYKRTTASPRRCSLLLYAVRYT